MVLKGSFKFALLYSDLLREIGDVSMLAACHSSRLNSCMSTVDKKVNLLRFLLILKLDLPAEHVTVNTRYIFDL